MSKTALSGAYYIGGLNMEMKTQQLTTFLSSCRGNWRNTIYIRDAASDGGYLMTADRDGVPILAELSTLSRLMGEAIDPTECRGQLPQDVFEDVYAQYLLWHMSSPQEHSLRALCLAGDGREATDPQ